MAEFTTIKEQLETNCDCLPEVDERLFERVLDSVISYISQITCWRTELCETFLNEERIELIPINNLECCGCDDRLMTITPRFFEMIDMDSFKVEFITVMGLSEDVVEIDSEYFSFIESMNELRIDLSRYYSCNPCCPPETIVRIRYYAGFDLIPDCLLGLFCDLMRVLYDQMKCDCGTCQPCEAKTNLMGEVDEDEIVNKTLDNFLNDVVIKGYINNLSMMSLCLGEHQPWGELLEYDRNIRRG